MQTLQFAGNDQMPILGLGTWKAGKGQVYTTVKNALECGYRHIDCAPIYGNEAEVGKVFAECFAENIASREQLWVTSKLWNNAHAPEDVQPALEKTLLDLQLEYLDLFLIHWPVHIAAAATFARSAKDYIPLADLPLIETWQAMEELVDKGLCRHIGVSNFSIAKLDDLLSRAKRKPEMNQIELHPYLQQPAMLDYCRKNDIHLTAYSPLGSGDRPKAMKAKDEPTLLQDPTIVRLADKNTITAAQLLLSWAIHRGTAVIPKSVSNERMKQNLAAGEITLSKEDIKEIDGLERNRRYVSGSFWTVEGSPYTLANLWDE